MGRWSPLQLAALALVGLSGCLLFTDPINEAPVVRIQAPEGGILRGRTAHFRIAELKDEDDLSTVEWATIEPVNLGCLSITGASWPLDTSKLGPDASYDVRFDLPHVKCVCARATDSHGAVGYAPCVRVEPGNADPVAIITDVEGKLSEATRPLCSDIHLSAVDSEFPRDTSYDTVEFNWSLVYSGSDPNGANVHLRDCDPVGDVQHRCFYAAVPGTYTVTLSITDTPRIPVGAAPLTSTPAKFVAKVAADRPAWLRRTNPEWDAQVVVLSRRSDLGGSYESRTFEVTSVDDDCEPIPAPAGKKEARLLWSIWGADKSNPKWEYQATSSKSLEVNQTRFPDALPGDVVKIRVEVLDAAADSLYKTPGYRPCLEEVDICCEAGDCAGENPPVRWTTWKVLFQP